jgi:hypothetical protein
MLVPDSACPFMAYHAWTIWILRNTSIAKERTVRRIGDAENDLMTFAAGENIYRFDWREVKLQTGIISIELLSKEVPRVLDSS